MDDVDWVFKKHTDCTHQITSNILSHVHTRNHACVARDKCARCGVLFTPPVAYKRVAIADAKKADTERATQHARRRLKSPRTAKAASWTETLQKKKRGDPRRASTSPKRNVTSCQTYWASKKKTQCGYVMI